MHIFLKKNWKKIIIGVAAILILLLVLFFCLRNISANNASSDIITQKEVIDGRQQITVLVKYAFAINEFEKAIEEKFSDVDIVQVGNYTHDMGLDEYESRLKNDDLTDIVMTWPLEVGEEYWDDRLLELSSFDFTRNYNLSMLDGISRDGNLYYLPGPAQVRGIVYNKTLFKERGWTVPVDYNGFVELCKTIEKSGMRSLQLGFKNSEVLDTAFIGYSYEECYSEPKDAQWLSEYYNGEHSFGEQFSSALDTFQNLIDVGVFQKNDLNISYSEREQMLFTRQCAMVEDSVLLARMGNSLTGTTDDYGLMPFFNPNGGSDWSRLYMVCYIGLNKHLADPENNEKYDTVMKIMQYISSQEGQEALMGDTGAMFSSLNGVSPPDVTEIEYLLNSLQEGRFAIFPPFKNSQSIRDGLAGMISGDLTKEDVIKMVDEQNSLPVIETPPKVLGEAESDFTMIETGNFITDVMREKGNCDIALFLDNGKDGLYNGKGVSARLYKGEVTDSDIKRILPDLKHGEDGVLWKVEMTGAKLIKTLEYSLKVDNNKGGWFYYFSGLKMSYNPTAKMGERIKSIKTSDGKEIDENKVYTVAVMDYTVPDENVKSCEKTDIVIADMLNEAILKEKIISPSNDGRFKVLS